MVGLAAGLLKHLARAFGSLHDSVLTESDLTLETKRMYQSVVLGVLLYGAETWTPAQELVSKLDWFHRYCMCLLHFVWLVTSEVSYSWGQASLVGQGPSGCEISESSWYMGFCQMENNLYCCMVLIHT